VESNQMIDRTFPINWL